MIADEPEFFSVGAEVPHRQSQIQLGQVQLRPVGVVELVLVVVVELLPAHFLVVEVVLPLRVEVEVELLLLVVEVELQLPSHFLVVVLLLRVEVEVELLKYLNLVVMVVLLLSSAAVPPLRVVVFRLLLASSLRAVAATLPAGGAVAGSLRLIRPGTSARASAFQRRRQKTKRPTGMSSLTTAGRTGSRRSARRCLTDMCAVLTGTGKRISPQGSWMFWVSTMRPLRMTCTGSCHAAGSKAIRNNGTRCRTCLCLSLRRRGCRTLNLQRMLSWSSSCKPGRVWM